MFTIKVLKPPIEDFTANLLSMRHGECGDSKISVLFENKQDRHSPNWTLICFRCHIKANIEVSTLGTAAISMTTLDGKKRTVQSSNICGDKITVEQFIKYENDLSIIKIL